MPPQYPNVVEKTESDFNGRAFSFTHPSPYLTLLLRPSRILVVLQPNSLPCIRIQSRSSATLSPFSFLFRTTITLHLSFT